MLIALRIVGWLLAALAALYVFYLARVAASAAATCKGGSKFSNRDSRERELFRIHTGPLGAGKTYSAVREAVEALKRGEPVYVNLDLSVRHLPGMEGIRYFTSVEHYAQHLRTAGGERGAAVVRWHAPIDLLHPCVGHGLILFDDFGALVNAREHESWPFALTVKLISLRKHHLSVEGTVQDDELGDKNLRRFYNVVFQVEEHRLPLLGIVAPKWRRPALPCVEKGCKKNHGLMTVGDRAGHFPWRATIYRRRDVHPRYTQNKEKLKSRGTEWLPFESEYAKCYQSAQDISADALKAYSEAQRTYERRQGSRTRSRFRDEE